MNEIEKLYENAGIEKKIMCDWTCNCGGKYSDICNVRCLHFEDNNLYYPPFTAEKQLELIKWIIGKYNEVSFSKRGSGYNICIDDGSFIGCHHNDKAFERCLAGDINLLWQDLTEKEKEQIRSVLDGN